MYRKHLAELDQLISIGPIVVYTCEAFGDFAATSITPNITEQLGYQPEEFLSVPGFWASNIHPDDQAAVFDNLGGLFEKGSHSHEYRFRHKNGDYRWMRDDLRLISDDAGKPVTIVGYWTDVTERRETEEKLVQAQKMEAVGQLTGGVAHDFNNLLHVIMGNLDLLQRRFGGERREVAAIMRAAQRGAELTQRLLAFSRRQSLSPATVDLAELVDGMYDMLTRTLGASVFVKTDFEPDLWSASADPGQVENALLNLVINARDAMPQGGELTIRCCNGRLDEEDRGRDPEAPTGEFVLICVTDSGFGMSEETRDRVFEPFFTTKEVGKGSGLGLSMVYGFAKQSGGWATIDSEAGKGTTVKLFLPRAKADARSAEALPAEDPPSGHGQPILVLEDDFEVNELTVAVVEELGYKVISAMDAAEARAVLDAGTAVDALISDVVLPGGMSGPEFAEEVVKRMPDLPIIFMSGYPTEAAMRKQLADSGRVLLSKPFAQPELAEALRAALG
jgi:PAS domain S-box-containing protein